MQETDQANQSAPEARPEASGRARLTPSLALSFLALVLWIGLGFAVPVGAGWPHLFLAAAVLLFLRWVVTGGAGW